MKEKKVYTQEELEKAIEDSFYPVLCGDNEFEVKGNAQVTAGGNAQVTAWDNAQVTAGGNAQVTAGGSAQVTAGGSAQVKAWDNAQVKAWDNAQVTATQYCVVTFPADSNVKVIGGVQIKVPPVKTAEEWCNYYGLEITDGIVILFKAVDEDFATNHSREKQIYYKPGNKPKAPDWDGGEAECGYGLHFCPTPAHAFDFNRDAKHFVACPVKVDEISVHFPASYPTKIKAPRVCAPCFEVDINGNKITGKNRVSSY